MLSIDDDKYTPVKIQLKDGAVARWSLIPLLDSVEVELKRVKKETSIRFHC